MVRAKGDCQMRVVVTGGAGFVGSAIVRRLAAAKHWVDVVDDHTSGDDLRIKNAWHSLRDEDAAKYDYSHADAIVHAAALPLIKGTWAPGEPERQWRCNAELVRCILERAPLDCLFVLISTASVYEGGVCDETTTPRATSPYAAAKLGAEGLVSAYTEAERVRGYVRRLPNVVGRHYHRGHIADFVRMAHEGHIHALDDGRNAKTFVHVEDVADEIADLIGPRSEAPMFHPPLMNIVSPYVWSWRDTVEVMRATRPSRSFKLTWEDRSRGWVGNPERLVVESRYRTPRAPRSIVAGVREALESLDWIEAREPAIEAAQ